MGDRPLRAIVIGAGFAGEGHHRPAAYRRGGGGSVCPPAQYCASDGGQTWNRDRLYRLAQGDGKCAPGHCSDRHSGAR